MAIRAAKSNNHSDSFHFIETGHGVNINFGTSKTSIRPMEVDNDGDILKAKGTSVPSDGDAGYAKGAIFIDTDVGAGTSGIYENVGTRTSANFDVIGAAGGGTFTGLTDTPANYSGAGDQIVKVNTGATGLEFVAPSGDATMSATGVFTVTDLTIATEARGDLVRRGASTWERVAAKTAGQVVMGDGTDVISQAISGDVALSGAGVATVTDLTIASETQGDVLYRNATNWVRLAAGTAGQALVTGGAGSNPFWGAPSVASASALADGTTLTDAGALDAVLSFTQQTVSAPTLTVPDFAGVSDTFVFATLAQTLVGKTLTAPTINKADVLSVKDSNNSHQLGFVCTSNLTANHVINLAPGDADRTLTLSGSVNIAGDFTTTVGTVAFAADVGGSSSVTLPATGTLATIGGTETLTAKTLTTPVIASILYSAGGNAITFQNAIHTVIGRDTSDTLTNKTIDCDGTGNVVSNVNGNELDSITGNNYGVPIIWKYTLTNQAAAVNITTSAPFKFKVIKAWSISTSADSGTWKLNNGAAGAGTDITNAVTVAASADDFDEPTDYTDSVSTINATGALSIVPDGGGLLDCEIYVMLMRID